MKMFLRQLIRKVIYGLFRLLTRLEVRGQENIPPSGACILAANHIDLLDGPLVYCLLNRRDATALAAKKHQRNTFYRWLVNATGGIWIEQESADLEALKQARQYLKNGGLLGISPEGTRSRTGGLIPAKEGAAYLASLSDPLIVPAALTGTETAIASLKRLQRPSVTATFGKPFRLPPLDRKDREGSLVRNTTEIMCQIAALLPAAYRGVYANHPRLKEILQESQL